MRPNDLEEMPVALELVIVVAVLRLQQVERLHVVRLGLHLGGQRLVHLEAVAVVEVGALGEAAGVLRIAPQQAPARCRRSRAASASCSAADSGAGRRSCGGGRTGSARLMCVGWNGRPICSIQYLVVIAKVDAQVEARVDDRVGQPLGPQSRGAGWGPFCFIIAKTSRQKPSCSLLFRPDSSCMRNWMASRLGHLPHELGQGRLGVGDEVLRRSRPIPGRASVAGPSRWRPGTPPPCTPPR